MGMRNKSFEKVPEAVSFSPSTLSTREPKVNAAYVQGRHGSCCGDLVAFLPILESSTSHNTDGIRHKGIQSGSYHVTLQ